MRKFKAKCLSAVSNGSAICAQYYRFSFFKMYYIFAKTINRFQRPLPYLKGRGARQSARVVNGYDSNSRCTISYGFGRTGSNPVSVGIFFVAVALFYISYF